MQLSSSLHDYDDLPLTHAAFRSMSVKVSLNPLTLYPFQSPLFKFSRHAVQFKRLQFAPVNVKKYFAGIASLKNTDHPTMGQALSSTYNPVGNLETPLRHPNELAHRFLTPLKWLAASKKMMAALAISLPMAYVVSNGDMTSNEPSSTSVSVAPKMATFDSIVSKQRLRVATVNGNTTYFGQDGFEHGFGYDVMRQYADHLNVEMSTQVFTKEVDAIAAVKAGKADIALTNLSGLSGNQIATDAELSSVSLSCDKNYLSQHGLNNHISVQLNPNDAKLNKDVKNFLCNGQSLTTRQHLAAFYSQNPLAESFNQQHFVQTMTDVLPRYESSFRKTAKTYNLDWELLVAMGYQESHLDAEAISPTGVRGIMMLTNATADAMGVDNRTDPTQSIQGGAKYLSLLQDEFVQVPASDRVWFTLAAYNMGPQAIKNVQQSLAKRGRDANSWAEVYQYLTVNSPSNSRYVQCLDYVTHIRSYLEALKLDKVNNRQLT